MKLRLRKGQIPPHLLRFFKPVGWKPKDEVDTPNMVCEALREDGWYRRQTIVWAKTNPMPESVRDRCTKAHEYVFLLAKSAAYRCDMEAIKEPAMQPAGAARLTGQLKAAVLQSLDASTLGTNQGDPWRNKRSVWTINPKPYAGAHFAVMPEKLVEPCVLAGCPEGGLVLDPFAGSGTVLAVAARLGRKAVGIELNPEYVQLARRRCEEAAGLDPLFTPFAVALEGQGGGHA